MTETILKGKKLVCPVRRIEPGEDIKYLLLIKVPNSDETYWEIITGREEAYKYIKNNISEIDVDESYIVANNIEINLDDMHTIYGFIKYVKEESDSDIVDEFDIDDYLSNNNNPSDIGVGLESAGQVFTGIAGSYESDEEEND